MKIKIKNKREQKGFTLIELLVVIAIIAILSIVVVLTLNPAEMLRRSRDSNRVSDLSMIRTALGLYLADVSTTAMGTSGTCYFQYSGTVAPTVIYDFSSSTPWVSSLSTMAQGVTTSTCNQWFVQTVATAISSTARSVASASSGWIPVNLSLISSGAPIGQWPADPTYSVGSSGSGQSSAAHFYSYIPGASNNQFKLAAKLESALYTATGTSDMESTDGGTDFNMYEQGTNLAL
jgi:prepilin-type N-terminal cleavage/methylation domain-containing protein